MNVNLNPGGFLGAALGAGIPFGIMVVTASYEGLARNLVVPGLVVGAIVGNFSWGAFSGTPDNEQPAGSDPIPKSRREPK